LQEKDKSLPTEATQEFARSVENAAFAEISIARFFEHQVYATFLHAVILILNTLDETVA